VKAVALTTAKDGQDPAGSDRRSKQWMNVLNEFIPTLAIIAAAWYALLTLSYDQFYRRLAVSLSDVGLSYSAILANSVGTGLAMGLLVALLSFPILGMRKLRRHEEWDQASFRRFARRVIAFVFVLCALVAITVLPVLSSNGFDRVTEGKAVLPPRLPLANFAILPIHADPVSVQPKDSEPTQVMGVESSKDSEPKARLLYLGQANGELVLYDSVAQHVLFIPSSDVIARITNCHIRQPPKPVCSDARSVIWPFSRWQRP
jgi:hypothetical protein